MNLNLLVLEVDGGLSNPRVLCAVVMWTALLSVVGALGARWVRTRNVRAVVPVAVFVLLSLVTSRAQLVIAEALYILTSLGGITGVGFWGGPPVWIAPVVASSVAFGVWLRTSAPALASGQRRGP